MFDAVARRSWFLPIAVVALAAVAGAALMVPDGRQRLSLLLAGGDPTASPVATARDDLLYPTDPLELSLDLEATFGEVDRARALGFADDLARELGWWLLEHTGGSDLEDAERKLWAKDGRPDPFVEAWSEALQRREVYARTTVPGLWKGPPTNPPIYVHPDELPLILLRVATDLDLRMELVRSPKHLYVLWREPGGERVRGIEPTAFRLFDRTGNAATESGSEPSVGKALTFEPDHFSSGTGGIRNPDPLPPGAYETVSPAALASDLLDALARRHDVDPAALEQRITGPGDEALAALAWRIRSSRGFAALERGEMAIVRAESAALAGMRSAHPDLVPQAPDERALAAAVAFEGGRDADARADLAAVFAWWEPDGTPATEVRSDGHAAAMWLALEYGPTTPEDWRARAPLIAEHDRSDLGRLVRLCALGRDILHDTDETPGQAVPACRPRE
ncbi:MAG: hypothetical protein H6738_22730 [Alphaproteobacteria bacterium]|nr:hypothetical protein [Alphaproteobacteria bacterium]